jgi:acetylornithine deacetylase/succinyl-diaminopimelate desuccinylase-like protein
VKNRPGAFAGAGFLLNEGGTGTIDGASQQVGIEVTQKVPIWLKLTATGNPGHGSQPQISTAVTRLVRALDRLRTHEFAPRIVPAVDAWFKGLAVSASPAWRDAFADMRKTVQDRTALLRLQAESPALAALTRNTCSITMLEGSSKVNVVPTEASAQIDCRMLPDQDEAAFLAELTQVLNEPAIRIEKVLAFTPAVSPQDNAVYRAMVDVTRQHFPQATIAPSVSTGFTDSHFFRDLGIPSYGYVPFLVPAAQAGGLHGNNERLSEENMRRGTAIMLEVVQRIARASAVP